MEADWAVEIGADLPCIDALWEGFIDLRSSSRAIDSVKEAVRHPGLRTALLALNDESSPVFTTKCDVWKLTGEAIDPDEFEANAETARAGVVSYIDIVEREPARFASFEFHERRAREVALHLRGVHLRQGRVDSVVRPAIAQERSGYGLTLYAAGSGVDEPTAYGAWQAVLEAAVAATMAEAPHPQRGEQRAGE